MINGVSSYTVNNNNTIINNVVLSNNNKTLGEESSDGKNLTDEEEKEVKELKKRDKEVRRHEQAHRAAGGQYVTGGSFEYETGPDNKRYAVGGEVNVDTSPVRDDPDATVRKAEVIKRAALAPADPSPQDRRVAAEAQRMENNARMEKAKESRNETDELKNDDTNSKKEPFQTSSTEESINKYKKIYDSVVNQTNNGDISVINNLFA